MIFYEKIFLMNFLRNILNIYIISNTWNSKKERILFLSIFLKDIIENTFANALNLHIIYYWFDGKISLLKNHHFWHTKY